MPAHLTIFSLIFVLSIFPYRESTVLFHIALSPIGKKKNRCQERCRGINPSHSICRDFLPVHMAVLFSNRHSNPHPLKKKNPPQITPQTGRPRTLRSSLTSTRPSSAPVKPLPSPSTRAHTRLRLRCVTPSPPRPSQPTNPQTGCLGLRCVTLPSRPAP